MAFNPARLSLLLDSIGGGAFRLFSYKTTDDDAVVLAAGYFTNAIAHKLLPLDVIWVMPTDGDASYMVQVTGIAADGSAVVILYVETIGIATEAENIAALINTKAVTPRGVQQQVRIYGTLALAAAAAIPSTTPRVTVLRYDSSSEFSPAEYIWQAGDPGHPMKFVGSTGFFVFAGNRLNAWAAGARESASNNATAFQRCKDWAVTKNEATVYIPGGLYVSGAGTDNSVYIWDLRELFDDHVLSWLGDGPGKTIIKSIAGAANVGAISLKNVYHFAWRGITFDGNYTNASSDSRHGLRSEGSADLTIDDFEFIECRGYCIGFQGDEDDGGEVRARVTNGKLWGGNRDAFDMKNRDGLNHDIIIDNLVCGEYDRALEGSPALDCRGPITVSNIHITIPVAGARGVKLRPDSDGSEQKGGRYSQVNNIIVDCNGLPCVAIDVENEYANVSNVTVYEYNASGGFAAVSVGLDALVCNLSNITVKMSADAAPGYGFTILTGFANLSNCHVFADNGGATGFYFETNAFSCVNCTTNGNTVAFHSITGGGSGLFAICKAIGGTVTLHADDSWINCHGFPSRNRLPLASTPAYADEAAATAAAYPQGAYYRVGTAVHVHVANP